MAAGVKKLSRTFVWILLGLLIAGLAGFGAVNFTGSVTSVATVGDEEITTSQYARELQREQQAISAQTGQQVPMSQMTALGMDRAVLGRLITSAALDHETGELGLSVGDGNLLEEITAIPAFQNASGTFDRDTYRFALDNAGLSENEFEHGLRRETARTLVQGAILAGTTMPPVMAETLTEFVGARRSFTYVQIAQDKMPLTADIPTDEGLKAFYDAHQDRFSLPETKMITYAVLRPDMLLDEVEVAGDAVRNLYDERSGQYQVPERRLVERLVFSSQDSADTAKAQLDAGGTTFEALVAKRGLDLADIDLGDVTMGDLGAAGEDVFAAQVGDVAGPLPSDLGPALYRVNGRLEAQLTPFDEAEAELRDELAAARARRLIETRAESIDDLLAGGATLEELKAETGMEVSQIGWHEDSDEDIAAYEGFRAAAAAVTAEDFPQVEFLEDGSVFAIRLDEVLPERPEPFEDAREKVLEAWQADRLSQAMQARAEDILAQAEEAGSFPEGLDLHAETGLTRTSYIDTTPADMMNQVFEMERGDLRVISGEDSTVVVKLDEILPPEESEDMQALAEAMSGQLDQSLAQAVFQAYLRDVRTRAAPRVDQQALNAVQANFQ